jgi:nucleoside-diphosphate-sugar epimerase
VTGVFDSLNGQVILVTGAEGFIGTALIQRLRTVACLIRRLVRASPAQPVAEGAAAVENVIGDVRDPAAWVEAIDGVDIVIHLAAQTSVYAAEQNPIGDLHANVLPILHLASAAKQSGRRPIVVAASTATVVGVTATAQPIDETAPDRPVTLYDVHKLMAEQYLEMFSREGLLRATMLRLTNVYGPGAGSRRRDRGVLNTMVRRALAGEPLTVYGAGEGVRDYVFVDDVVSAFAAAVASEQTRGRHFLIGSGRGVSIRQAFELAAARAERLTGRLTPVISVDPPADLSVIESRSFVANIEQFRHATGWSPGVSLERGIDLTIEAMAAASPSTRGAARA